mmetsp:Transcript_8879/g.16376  ORF Transcript_8879/g.16376 Transcript_8879/m.16376 type:complete len:93 (+) Transcript_8879:703-981(+)
MDPPEDDEEPDDEGTCGWFDVGGGGTFRSVMVGVLCVPSGESSYTPYLCFVLAKFLDCIQSEMTKGWFWMLHQYLGCLRGRGQKINARRFAM